MSKGSIVFYVFGTVVGWASAFVAVRALVQTMSPGSIACARYLVASLVLLLPLLWGDRYLLPRKKDVPRFLLMGLCGFGLYNLMFNLGLQTVPAGTTALALNGAVVMTGLLGGYFLLGEHIPTKRWLAVLVILLGLTLIAMGGGVLQANLGMLYIFFSGVLGGCYNILQKTLLPQYGFRTCVTYSIWFGMIPLLWWLPEVVLVMPQTSASVWFWLVFLGVVPGVLSYTWWGKVLKELPATIASPLIATVPAVVILMAWFVLGEFPSTLSLVGGAVSIAGVIWSSLIRAQPQKSSSI